MSRKYSKKGETALLDDDSLTSTPSSVSRGGERDSRRNGGRSSGSKARQQPQYVEATAPPPEVEEEEDEEPKGFFSSKTNIIGAVVSVLVILAIIAGVAWFLLSAPADAPTGPPIGQWAQMLLDNVNRSEIDTNFQAVTAYSSLSGTKPSLKARDFVSSAFTASLLGNASVKANVTVHEYFAVFNYPAGYDPNADSPSAAAALGSRRLQRLVNGTAVWTASLTENVIEMDSATKRPDAVPTCNRTDSTAQRSTAQQAPHRSFPAHAPTRMSPFLL